MKWTFAGQHEGRGVDRQHRAYMNESLLFLQSLQPFLSYLHIRVQEELNQNELPVHGLHTRDLNHLEIGQESQYFSILSR